MAAPARRAQPGEPLAIPAAVWNDLVAMLRERGRDGTLRPGGESAGRGGLVLVRNASGQDVGWFGILGVDGVVYTPEDDEAGFLGQPVLDGKKPTQNHRGRFVIVLEPVAAGAIGRALVQGLVPVKVDVADEDHEFADVADGECDHLASGTTGAAQVLWKQAGTGTKWAIVRVGLPAPSVEVEVVTDLRYDTETHAFQVKTRTVRVPWADDESEWTDVVVLTECDDVAPE